MKSNECHEFMLFHNVMKNEGNELLVAIIMNSLLSLTS